MNEPDAAMPTRLDDVDIAGIKLFLPHRYPFLMLDRVVDVMAHESAVGIKNVTINEPFFPGHFPSRPIMPGVLIVEAMAQTAAVLVAASICAQGKLVYLATVDQARFRRPVEPGDTLRIKVTHQRNRLNMWKFKGVAEVDGRTVADAMFSAKIVDN